MRRDLWRTLPLTTDGERATVAALPAAFRAVAPPAFTLELEVPSVESVDAVVRFDDESWDEAMRLLDGAILEATAAAAAAAAAARDAAR